MLDVVIVGGGACGLALARGLAAAGVSFALYEARPRLGGRVLSVEDTASGMRVDLGPTWFWPDTQPTITALVNELGLADFPQYDPGTALLLAFGDKKPETRMTPNLHSGARRLEGGMASLIEALAADGSGGVDPSLRRAALHRRSRRSCGADLRDRTASPRPSSATRRARAAAASAGGASRLRSGARRADPQRPAQRADLDGGAGQGRGRLCRQARLARGWAFRQRFRHP